MRLTKDHDVRRQYTGFRFNPLAQPFRLALEAERLRLAAGYAASTANHDLRCFHAFLLYLQSQDCPVPQALLCMPSLKEPDRLPRFLTDEQVRRLRDEFERRATQAGSPSRRRDALLDRAALYLLWQAGLRLGEVEELRLEDLAGRKLTVHQGKGVKDRIMYLTDTMVWAIQAVGQRVRVKVSPHRLRHTCAT